MITSNKKVSLLIASAIFVSPLLTSADMDSSTGTMDNNMTPPPAMGQGQMMMSGSSSTSSAWQTTKEDRTKIDYIMKSLEAELKIIRESITKDNIVEMKQKALDLQETYVAKIAEVFPDRAADLKKMIDYRFTIFFNNQFKIREDIKEIKDNTKDVINKAKEVGKDAVNKAKEMAKNAIDAAKDAKKTENNQVRTEKKEVKQDLKAQYKARFIAQLKNKLDNIPVEKLQLVITNVTNKRAEIDANTKISATTKTKYLAQIDALLEILNEKVSASTDTLDINKLIDDAANTNSSTGTATTVTQ